MSLNKEKEIKDNHLHETNENSGNCSESKTSTSLNYQNGNYSKDKIDKIDSGCAPLELKILSSNDFKLNGNSYNLENLPKNLEKGKECFNNFFFKCLKYLIYKKEFKDNFNKGIAENNVSFYLFKFH